MKKTLITILATVLVCCCVVGGTLAWLMDSTETITNTFTVGNVDIELKETDANGNVLNASAADQKASFKMLPGNTIAKNPTITVKANSEASWLFVKVEKSSTLDTYITWVIADGWTELESGVYYREAAATADADDEPISILKGDSVTVKNNVTKAQMDALNAADATQPTLSFTAYAVQKDANVNSAAAAWSVATTGNLPTT
jgi:predicted ribosomally synthesized peptide with SipW-like signal peptide